MRQLPLLTTILFVFSSASCRQRANLHDRIMAAKTSQYCVAEACFNPHVLAVERGFVVTTFSGARPQHAIVKPEELGSYLESRPMQAWPRGPSIEVSPTDVFADERAVRRNLDAAQQVCRSMGLQVQVLPGG
jgi:hypothetical protein